MTGNPLDLRAWLSEVRGSGELKDVHGADWNLELGAISELNVKKDAPPALLFDRHPGLSGRLSRAHLQHEQSRRACPRSCGSATSNTHHGLVQKLRGKPAQWQARGGELRSGVCVKAARCSKTSQQ